MKILLTGSAGFIGTHLYKYLLEQGHSVIGFDIENEPKQDIRHCSALYFSNEKFDAVIHLAALRSVPKSIKGPRGFQETNCRGFENVLQYCVAYNIPRLIYASSSSVYGKDVKKFPMSEGNALGKCLSPYAATKRHNEAMAQSYYYAYGLKTIGLRFFNVFGPGQQDPEDAGVVTKWIYNLAKGMPCVINDVNACRDFTYIKDVVKGIECALTTEFTDAFGGSWNIGSGKPYIMAHVSAHINRILCQKLGLRKEDLKIEIGKPRHGDIGSSIADITNAFNLLHYAPEYDLVDGLNDFLVEEFQRIRE